MKCFADNNVVGCGVAVCGLFPMSFAGNYKLLSKNHGIIVGSVNVGMLVRVGVHRAKRTDAIM